MGYKSFKMLHLMINEVKECLETGLYDNKTLIWFGYTKRLLCTQEELIKIGTKIDFAVDNDEEKWDTSEDCIIKCYSPDV